MPSTMYHRFAKKRKLLDSGELTTEEIKDDVDRQINEVLVDYANTPWWESTDAPWPQVSTGRCLRELRWCDEEVYLLFDGRRNHVVSDPSDWPDVPCRLATPEEFRQLSERVSVAVAISRRPGVSAGTKATQVCAALREAVSYVQLLRV